jgi:hypothetical protein
LRVEQGRLWVQAEDLHSEQSRRGDHGQSQSRGTDQVYHKRTRLEIGLCVIDDSAGEVNVPDPA